MVCPLLSSSSSSIVTAALALLVLSIPTASARMSPRFLLSNETAAAMQRASECGKPNALCGNAVPKGVTCSKGAGWCQEGYHCGKDTSASPYQSRCLPVPKDCGKAGSVCCPSNTDTPHTSKTETDKRYPFCRDGSTCFYYYELQFTAITPDPHAGIPGYACVAVPKDCGAGPNTPCCPSRYKVATNPKLDKPSGCAGNSTFCQMENLPKGAGKNGTPWVGKGFPGSDMLSQPPGVCLANAPDCSKVGKPCCIANGGATTVLQCFMDDGRPGKCVTAAGLTWEEGAMEKDLICTAKT